MQPELVNARKGLLDAIEALGRHREAVVLVGAQAIYMRVGSADLSIEPFTLDGDMALDPDLLGAHPPIAQALADHGFVHDAADLGRWCGPTGVVVDLMVAEALGGGGRRGARLPEPHGKRVARKAKGLEAAMVDNDGLEIASLDVADGRRYAIRVADEAALLVAKAHKIYERKDDVDRIREKDSLDVLRLLRGTDTERMAARIERLLDAPVARDATRAAVSFLQELYESPEALGSSLAAAAANGLEDPEEISQSCAVLAEDFLRSVEPSL